MEYVIEYHMKTGGKVQRGFETKEEHEKAVRDYSAMRSGVIYFTETQSAKVGEEDLEIEVEIIIPYDSIAAVRAYVLPEAVEDGEGEKE